MSDDFPQELRLRCDCGYETVKEIGETPASPYKEGDEYPIECRGACSNRRTQKARDSGRTGHPSSPVTPTRSAEVVEVEPSESGPESVEDEGNDSQSNQLRLWGYRILSILSGSLAIVWAGVVMVVVMQRLGTFEGVVAYVVALSVAKAIDEFLWKRQTEIHTLKLAALE